MQRVQIDRPGGYDKLKLVTEPDPSALEDQVVVRVRAAGVTYADCVVRMGLYESAKKYVGWPITPGFELSGEVVEVGARVTRFTPGQRVFGVVRFGGYASHAAVDQRQLFPIPDGWTFEQAGGFSTAYLTAWYALRELCRLRPGYHVLIHSAAGGVGSAATEIVEALGARAIGVVGSSHKVATAKAAGCWQVIDKSSQDLWPTLERLCPEGVDVVLDPNGAATLKEGYRHLKPTGRLIIYGFQSMLPKGRGVPSWLRLLWTYLKTPRFNPLHLTNDNKSVLAFNLSYLFEQLERLEEAMTELITWVEEGKIRPLPSRTFPLSQAAEAQRALESGTTTGKLVLIPDSD